ncbi:MAG: hypothetical protein IPL40_05565 [Proteobacteria bacterium]|nr:hypothetical protein [Pseudomonadota bacterium]
MQLDTTYRGLSNTESATATRMLEKFSPRLVRLLDEPSSLRAVVESGAELKVTLTVSQRRGELTASTSDRELATAVSDACDKLRAQLVRQRHRREAERHRATGGTE